MSAHDHEHHDPNLQHHFESMDQQFHAGKLGMWLFLATEILLFGGLFCGYTIWRANNPEIFEFGSQYLDTTLGAVNTCVLILSSLTMAYGVTCAQTNRRGMLVLMLALTLLGAATFMVIKYFEYTDKFAKGIYPGVRYYQPPTEEYLAKYGIELTDEQRADIEQQRPQWGAGDVDVSTIQLPAQAPTGVRIDAVDPTHERYRDYSDVKHHMLREDRPPNAHMFFNVYFMMTGLHGLHVVFGGIFIIWLLIKALGGAYSSSYYTPVDLGGLYWHVVDLIWIFLFPLFYLI